LDNKAYDISCLHNPTCVQCNLIITE